MEGLALNGENVNIWPAYVSDNFFDVMGVQPMLGRFFRPAQGNSTDSDPVLVLSYSFWKRHFAGDRKIIGTIVSVSGRPVTVIGVAPKGFCGFSSILDTAFSGSTAVPKLATFRNAGGDVMRNFVLQAATFVLVATAAFSQQSAVSASNSEVSQKDEQQIQQLEAEMLNGEMNSDPVVFEKILADDCLNLPAGPDLTKANLVEGVRKSQGQAPPYIAREQDMHVYMLGDTAWKLKISRSTHQKAES
jgi:hypothetical protein